jgi:hypothetical protein
MDRVFVSSNPIHGLVLRKVSALTGANHMRCADNAQADQEVLAQIDCVPDVLAEMNKMGLSAYGMGAQHQLAGAPSQDDGGQWTRW